jgi:hypothetical protein
MPNTPIKAIWETAHEQHRDKQAAPSSDTRAEHQRATEIEDRDQEGHG